MSWSHPEYLHLLWIVLGWILFRFWRLKNETRTVSGILVWKLLLREDVVQERVRYKLPRRAWLESLLILCLVLALSAPALWIESPTLDDGDGSGTPAALDNRGITALGVGGQTLLIGITSSPAVSTSECEFSVSGDLITTTGQVVLNPGKQVDVLLPLPRNWAEKPHRVRVTLGGSDDVKEDDKAAIKVGRKQAGVGVAAGLTAVMEALLSSGSEVLSVDPMDYPGDLQFIARRWGADIAQPLMAFLPAAPATTGPFGAPIAPGKYGAYGPLSDLPLTGGLDLPCREVVSNPDGGVVFLQRGEIPLIVGYPKTQSVLIGLDPSDAAWQSNPMFPLLLARLAAWLKGPPTPASSALYSVSQVRGDLPVHPIEEASQSTPRSSRTELYPWVLLLALLIMLALLVPKRPFSRAWSSQNGSS